MGGVGEFREDYDIVVFVLGGNVFVGDEVYVVVGGWDEVDVGDGVKSGEFIERDGLVEEVDGYKFDGVKVIINMVYEFVDNGLEVLVFFDVLMWRDGNLDEYNVFNLFGVFGEEDFESVEFLRDIFDIVEVIDINDEFDIFEFVV